MIVYQHYYYKNYIQQYDDRTVKLTELCNEYRNELIKCQQIYLNK